MLIFHPGCGQPPASPTGKHKSFYSKEQPVVSTVPLREPGKVAGKSQCTTASSEATSRKWHETTEHFVK